MTERLFSETAFVKQQEKGRLRFIIIDFSERLLWREHKQRSAHAFNFLEHPIVK